VGGIGVQGKGRRAQIGAKLRMSINAGRLIDLAVAAGRDW
jgi:hypothetical protein